MAINYKHRINPRYLIKLVIIKKWKNKIYSKEEVKDLILN